MIVDPVGPLPAQTPANALPDNGISLYPPTPPAQPAYFTTVNTGGGGGSPERSYCAGLRFLSEGLVCIAPHPEDAPESTRGIHTWQASVSPPRAHTLSVDALCQGNNKATVVARASCQLISCDLQASG